MGLEIIPFSKTVTNIFNTKNKTLEINTYIYHKFKMKSQGPGSSPEKSIHLSWVKKGNTRKDINLVKVDVKKRYPNI